MKRWALSTLSLLITPAVTNAVTGKGPTGVHPINDRYLAVVDSSIDSILIVDGNAAGAVVGHLVLHDRNNDPSDADAHIGGHEPLSSWINPISISTCDECKHLFITSPDTMYRVALERPLAIMAQNHDFSALNTKSTVREFWPNNWSQKYKGDGLLRMVSVAPDGSSAYVSHSKGGVFSFDPLEPVETSEKAKHAIHVGDAGIDEQEINGIHHTHSLKNLVLTSSKYVHIVKLKDDTGINPLDDGSVTAYRLPLDYHCDYLYGGNKMTFMDTVIINDYAFVLGHPIERGIHNGVALYRLTWDEDQEQWHDCVQVAGSGVEAADWVDGTGKEARFSMTPHDIALLPSMTSHTIVVADVDNRALRYVDVTGAVETGDQTQGVSVTSVAYNEDLFMVLYKKEEPWTTLSPETVMKTDGKSYYHSGEKGIMNLNYEDAQEECSRVGIGRICTLPEIRARFARGQYPTVSGDDNSWSTVWTNEQCSSCHLEQPGSCAVDGPDSWGQGYKMVANFSPKHGLRMQCSDASVQKKAMSMCCGLGGPAVMNAESSSPAKTAPAPAPAPSPATQSAEAAKTAGISLGVLLPVVLMAVAFGLFMRKRAKPAWWPKMFRKDMREETGHAPHREVDLRGRDYI
mmetsp:Transcript_31115/g.65073  ORF Transcript_31115/g.65073 Transcript_31115/m.65073 type:complete len:630 (+) Transcript_31115:92-1981(+)|eukprot:CAMPEP_0171341594 /NCGR_PEP_ID=MMETSP0878-20121228/10982_1 /TAXON_ID=67004 /ORGANISM="Thalassiosira weissflogii, Strain CCMP1336" /LENGTH=629 /DNA_ID=CAMNT_0011843917 /DNA_START=59 /DNA_END=1948 /DNA_ORIENTATION=+